MVRRSPCEYYLKYLLVHPDEYTDDNIRNLTQLQQLDFIGLPYLGRLRQALATPLPFYPEDRTHQRSQDFLTRERIWSMFHPDEDMLAAQEAVDMPRVKEVLETVLISSVTHEHAAVLTRSRAGFDMTPRAVSLFHHYFFNTSIVDTTELRALLEVRSDRDESQDPDVKRLGVALHLVGKTDPRRMLAKIGSAPMAALMNSMRMGYLPPSLDISRIAAATRAAATIQAFNSAMNGWADSSRDFALVSKAMTEMLQSIGDASVDLQTDIAQMLLETEHSDVPHIESLRGIPELQAVTVEVKGEPVE